MSESPWEAERQAADDRDRKRQPSTNAKGIALVRAELRRLGLPEHGPNWKEPAEQG